MPCGAAWRQASGHAAVAHAEAVREAVFTDDFAAFFRLYARAPNMGRALMDLAVAKMRWLGLNVAVRAFRPTLPVAVLARMLGFVARADASGAGGDGAPPQADARPLPGCSRASYEGTAKPQVGLGTGPEPAGGKPVGGEGEWDVPFGGGEAVDSVCAHAARPPRRSTVCAL
jgi:hypothetical protein